MANFNLDQALVNKGEKIDIANHIVAKSHSLKQAVKGVVTVLLLISTTLTHVLYVKRKESEREGGGGGF